MSPTLADFGHGYLLERGRPAIGSRPLLVILAEYTDDGTGEWPSIASLHPREYYDGLAFGTPTPPFSTSDPINPGSLTQYFRECSSGRFTPTRAQGGGLIGPFIMGPFPNPDPGLEVTAQQVITAAGRAFPDVFIGTDTDLNRDVTADELLILIIHNFTGYGPGNRANAPATVTKHAPLVPDEQVTVTVLVAGDGTETPFYQIAHELSHSLGTIDLYGSGNENQLLTLMSSYSFTSDNQVPVHLDAWHKIALGWCEPRIQQLRASAAPIIVGEISAQRPDGAVILWDPSRWTGEYFILERRTPTGVNQAYDSGVSGDGLLIWRFRAGEVPVVTHLGAPDGEPGGNGVWRPGQSFVLPWNDQTSTSIELTFAAAGNDIEVSFGARQPALIVPRPTRLIYASSNDGRGVIGDIDRGGNLHDLVVLEPGTFKPDWTHIVGIGADRILYYSATDGRGVIGSLPSVNKLDDLRAVPPGTFATDWTSIISLGNDRILYYSATDGRGVIGSIDAGNNLHDLAVILLRCRHPQRHASSHQRPHLALELRQGRGHGQQDQDDQAPDVRPRWLRPATKARHLAPCVTGSQNSRQSPLNPHERPFTGVLGRHPRSASGRGRCFISFFSLGGPPFPLALT
jgi:M6 family metalloprotease-like protein